MTRTRSISTSTALASFLIACLLMTSSLKADPTPSSGKNAKAGGEAGVSAFGDIASVLTSPRCLNCHLAGQSPLQGDDSHAHTMNVKRGADGRGTPAMRCTNCHQSTNSAFPHETPAPPDW